MGLRALRRTEVCRAGSHGLALVTEIAMQRQNDSGSKLETTDPMPSGLDPAAHDEWLLDEALEETFPASDPVLPARPGSSLSLRHTVIAERRRTVRKAV